MYKMILKEAKTTSPKANKDTKGFLSAKAHMHCHIHHKSLCSRTPRFGILNHRAQDAAHRIGVQDKVVGENMMEYSKLNIIP